MQAEIFAFRLRQSSGRKQRVSSNQIDARGGDAKNILEPFPDDIAGEPPARGCRRSGVADAGLGEKSRIETDGHFALGRPRAAVGAGDADAVLALRVNRHTAEVGSDIGGQVSRRIVHFIKKLLLHRRLRDAAAGVGQFGGDGAAVTGDFGDRIAALPSRGTP